MTITLKKQLGLWFGGALICVTALQGVRAFAAPEEKLTAEEVSRRFGPYVNGNSDVWLRARDVSGLLTRQNNRDFSSYQLGGLLSVMAEEYGAVAFKSQIVDSKSGKAIVRIVPLKEHPGREFVCIKEDGGYKIDILATYGRWNNLSGVALSKRMFDLTGAVLPDLPRNSKIENSLCQSNLKQIALGLKMYMQDYDERLPPDREWSEVLGPYLENRALFNCPTMQPNKYGYAFNSLNSMLHEARYEEIDRVVSVFDAQVIAKDAKGGQTDIANRHMFASSTGSNVAFMDGHVKFIGSKYNWDDGRFTFVPKLGPIPTYGLDGMSPPSPRPDNVPLPGSTEP